MSKPSAPRVPIHLLYARVVVVVLFLGSGLVELFESRPVTFPGLVHARLQADAANAFYWPAAVRGKIAVLVGALAFLLSWAKVIGATLIVAEVRPRFARVVLAAGALATLTIDGLTPRPLEGETVLAVLAVGLLLYLEENRAPSVGRR